MLLADVAIDTVCAAPAVLTETVPAFTFLFSKSVTAKVPDVANMKL